MTWPEERKLVELKRKLGSLDGEFKDWESQTESDKPLRKHHSQISRITRQLRVPAKRLGDTLAELEADDSRVLAESRELEGMILDLHRIWDFFRSKLSQRHVESFQKYLLAADEFAWDCYAPARAAAAPAVIPADRIKEPPLVFLNGGWSPFALSRGAAFEAEWVPDEEIATKEYRLILKDLPIPVIGMPWYQVRHFPDAVTIGHEVGHNVEEDFELTETLQSLLERAMDKARTNKRRRPGWRRWLSEIFADLYGLLATGPAFVSALMDFVAVSSRTVTAVRQGNPDWLDHPPDALRVLFNLDALKVVGLGAESDLLRATWLSRYPQPYAMAAFEADIHEVVVALLKGPYPGFAGKSLPCVISFGKRQQTQTALVKTALADGSQPTGDVRALVAGCRLAFDAEPARFLDDKLDNLVLTAIKGIQSSAVRDQPGSRPPAEDVAAGNRLFDRMKALRT